MAEETQGNGSGAGEVVFESPPVAARPAREEPDPRLRLAELAAELARARNRRAIVEYLRIRRSLR